MGVRIVLAVHVGRLVLKFGRKRPIINNAICDKNSHFRAVNTMTDFVCRLGLCLGVVKCIVQAHSSWIRLWVMKALASCFIYKVYNN